MLECGQDPALHGDVSVTLKSQLLEVMWYSHFDER